MWEIIPSYLTADDVREIQFIERGFVPPVAGDLAQGGRAVFGGAWTEEDLAKRLATGFRKVMPQMNRMIEESRLRLDDDFRRSRLRGTHKKGGGVRKGQEGKRKHYIDLGQK